MQNTVQYPNPSQHESSSGQPQTVFVQVPRQPSRIYKEYQSKQSIGLAVIQICVGILCIILNAVAIPVLNQPSFLNTGYGIWSGVFFILAGSFGIFAAPIKSKCMIITCMVLSIISACLAVLFVLSASAVVLSNHASDCYNWHDGYDYETGHGYHHRVCDGNAGTAVIAMEAVLLFLGLVEGVAAIWSSAICGAAFAYSSGPSQGEVIQANPHIVQYNQTAVQPQVVCLNTQLQSVGYLQQPLQLQQATAAPAAYTVTAVTGTTSCRNYDITPYELRTPPQQQA